MRSPEHAERRESASEIDLRALGEALKRRRRAIVLPTLLAFVIVAIFVNVVTPRYTAETQVLLENQETFFTRPDRGNLPPEQALQVDQEGVASQVQLISSRDIARRAIKKLGLAGDPEFDSLAGGLNPFTRVLVLLGIVADPTLESADSRIVTKFLEKLTVFSPPKTRVIAIQFTSRDAALAARAANTIAQLYLQEQSAAKRTTAKIAAEALSTQITDLRARLAKADADREQYRLQSGLLAGSNNMTISGQQLADINSDLSKARSAQADAQAKAELIRELIREGKAANVADVINNDIVRRVSDQRFAAQAQLGREARTLLPGHPRIKELTAQLAEYDAALKSAARQAAVSLENDAKIAGQRVANLEAVLAQQTKVAGVANTDEVKLRALDRFAQSLKDQLDSSTTKYQEALARQTSIATPADARVISGATRPQEPSFPKKIPFIVFGTIATLVFATGFVVAAELLGGKVAQASAAEGREPVFEEETSERATAARQSPGREVQGASPRDWSFFEEEPAKAVFAAPERKIEANLKGHPQGNPKANPVAARLREVTRGGIVGAALTYLKGFGQSAEASRTPGGDVAEVPGARYSNFGWDRDDAIRDDVPEPARTAAPAAAAETAGVSHLVDRIVAAHVPGRGVHVVGTCLGAKGGPDVLIELGRKLSIKGRAIIVDLNRLPLGLSQLAGADDEGHAKISAMHGLSELLSADATFAEVIHRDQESRLHFVPTGLQEADFRDFDLILDALSETYDFILLMAPDYPQSEIAKIMAPYADFVVLAATQGPGALSISALEDDLLDAGAREVLVAGAPRRQSRAVA